MHRGLEIVQFWFNDPKPTDSFNTTVMFWYPLNLLLMLLSFSSCLFLVSLTLTHTVCLFFALLPHFIDFCFFCFVLFPVLCPLLADWALCCMLVVMSQFECSQTVSRAMGIQVNKGKVNPLTHNRLSSPIISQRQPATLLTHIQTQFPFRGPNEGD